MRQVKDQELHSKLGIKGKAHLQLFGPDGELKEERIIHNTVTELMDVQVADQMSDQGQAAIGFMAVGTGSGQGSADTGLAVSLDRNALDSTTQGAGGDDNDVIYVCTWAAGDGTGAITEAGVLQADNNTTMMLYADFAAVNKGGADSLVITWTATFGAS
ncbi:MAG: hypothetical protein KAR06_04975 [Deltaproteobacteria bacterium]|nr:hypothetical protein [Deltaproteobacteria bacterium]